MSRGGRISKLFDAPKNYIFAGIIGIAFLISILVVLYFVLPFAPAREIVSDFPPEDKYSAAVEKYIRSENISIHLVPPHNHRVNAAEQAIATFKEHFIAALATVDMHCPL